ncbi:hypothetical protein [Pseudarthrobacter sp. B4EP4b]|uniref:hypothetical protein n=1 Tax=Pseudarthrobacter sp. B4EP4b TaxID=2590664 RepID=UPI001151A652|nr:hypothetical protein [Pseudarthrobacter sp. B4EP4b]
MKIGRFHLAGYLLSGAARLRDHIERIDDGAAYAVDDLALVLRLLISGARGGELIARTANSYGIQLPKFGVSAEPQTVPGIVWAAGAMPTTEALGTGGLVDINQLRFKTALRIQPGSKQVDLTWDKFIRDYANYWGTHVGDAIRDDVHLADRIGTAAGLPLTTYMLRETAVAAWYSAQYVLRNAMVQDDPQFFADVDIADEDLKVWISPPGGLNEPPSIRGELGKFQNGTNAGSTASLVWAVEHPLTEVVTLGELFIGGLPYQIRLAPDEGITQSDYNVPRQRSPMHPNRVSFSKGKSVTISPQFVQWDSENYMLGMSGFIKKPSAPVDPVTES